MSNKWIDINCWIIYIFAFICFHPLMSWSTGHLIRQLWLIFFHPENLTKMSFQINLIGVLCRYFAQICLIEFFSSVEIYNQDNYVFCVNYRACPNKVVINPFWFEEKTITTKIKDLNPLWRKCTHAHADDSWFFYNR